MVIFEELIPPSDFLPQELSVAMRTTKLPFIVSPPFKHR